MVKKDNNIGSKRILLENIKDISVTDKQFKNIIIFISTFQNINGTFDLVNREDVPKDTRVYLCDEPTYICTSLYIKTFINDKKWFEENIGFNKLDKALNICCKLGLRGHGYEALETQLTTMKMFLNNGLKQFLRNYSNLNHGFSNMIKYIINDYKEMKKANNYNFGFGSYEKEVEEILSLYEE